MELKTVRQYCRFLKESGWISSGGRGPSAANMTPLDAARITISVLATEKPANAVARLERFRKLPYRGDFSEGVIPPELEVDETSTLEQVIEQVFSPTLEQNTLIVDKWLSLEICESGRRANLSFWGGDIIFLNRELTADDQLIKDEIYHGRQISRKLMFRDLHMLHTYFYQEYKDGISWEERYRGHDNSGNPLDPAHPFNSNLPPDEHQKRLLEIQEFIENRQSAVRIEK